MRMIIAGGGTGGHLFPGLAVAEALRARGGEAVFIGSASGIEARVIPQTDFRLRTVAIRGVRGRGLRGGLDLAVQLPVALAVAWQELARFRPAVVVGVGGYASFPVVAAAWLRRIPIVLLEQNARPGLATRVLARVARAVCAGFPETAEWLPGTRVVCTGTPVRQRLLSAAPKTNGSFTLLIFGGSQGAHRINTEAVAAVREVAAQVPGLRVIHQTGDADCDGVREQYEAMNADAAVFPFITDMAAAYARADLVICRAGTTVAELTALGKAAILIPYPFAADDHQRANAESVQRRGAAEMVLDRDLSGSLLAARILELVRDPQRLAAMREAARGLGRADAAERVVDVCERVVSGGLDG